MLKNLTFGEQKNNNYFFHPSVPRLLTAPFTPYQPKSGDPRKSKEVKKQ